MSVPVTRLLTAIDLAYEPDDYLRRELHVFPPGIPFFWRVDEGPRLQSFRLDPHSGRYDTVVEIGPGEAGEPLAPWPVHLDTTDLVMPHKR